jgi:hypothetical protein
MADYNTRFGHAPANAKNLHRKLTEADDLSEVKEACAAVGTRQDFQLASAGIGRGDKGLGVPAA